MKATVTASILASLVLLYTIQSGVSIPGPEHHLNKHAPLNGALNDKPLGPGEAVDPPASRPSDELVNFRIDNVRNRLINELNQTIAVDQDLLN